MNKLTSLTQTVAPTWVFTRGGDHMRIQRSTATRLVVSSSIEGVRQLDFASIGDLLDFQVSYENNLARDGWTLVEFQPERRSQPDRRKIPRFGEDRRRRPAPSKLP